MSLSSLSIKRPVLATVMSIGIVLFGGLGYKFLGIREYPSIDPPVITVRTSYAGANPDVMESQVTEPLEKAINGIQGVRTISSTSSQGVSIITVEFNLDADLETAANDVRDKVSQSAKLIPQDIDAPPVVTKSDANSDAILSMTIQSDNKNILQLDDYAENVLLERLQTIPGVSTIQIWGQKKYAMRLWLNPAKMSSYKITPLDVKNALDKENIELPSGKIEGNNTELNVRTIGRLSSENEFNDLIVKNDGAQTIRLKDIGRATLGAENEETNLKKDGVPMIALALVPQPGANYIDIADEFYMRLEQLKKDVPADIHLDIAMDNTKFIKRSIKEVEETLLIAFVLVVLIIYLFFRDWIIAFRPLIDIPVSLIGAFFIMWVAGFSINILTLLAIVLATGLVVDDGIVVTENIYKKIEAGMAPKEAALKGSQEIFFAVLSTSITLAAVFLPIIFLQGFVGRLFREFGIVVAGAVLISAFVSLTLTPMLNVKLARKGNKRTRFYELTEPFFEGMTNSYSNALNSFMKKRGIAFLLIGICMVMIFGFGKVLQSELAPMEDRGLMRMTVTAPEGASYEFTDNYLNNIAALIQDSIKEKKLTLSVTAPGFNGPGAVNSGFARIVLNDPGERKRTQHEIAQKLQSNLKYFPEAKAFVIEEQTISGGGAGRTSLPVQFVLQAPDFKHLQQDLPKFMDKVSKDPTFMGTDVNLKFNKPELYITIDRNRARTLGVNVMDIGQTLQLAYSSQRIGYFVKEGKQYQVISQVNRANRDEPLDLKSLYVRNNTGDLIQLDNVVNVEEKSSPPQLFHYNRYISATVSAGLAPGKTVGDGIAAMQAIADKTLDPSFTTGLSGASRDFAESSSNILFAFILALVIIYLVLAAQFESFIDPFIIMLTVPLALAGALLSLWYFDQTLNIFSQIGIIMLIGLVTKNGILIVEFANQFREKGMNKFEAVKAAAASRLRPILMTSLATALGALPIALAFGAGAKSRVPLGIVIIGGLMFSLVLTLFVIPAFYTYLSRAHNEVTDEQKEVAAS